MAKYLCIFFLSFMILGCTSKDAKNYSYSTGHVDSTKHVHAFKGYYKLQVYYTFVANNKEYKGEYVHKLEKSYTAKYEMGDSILVKFNTKKPRESTIIRITDKKRKIRL